MRITLAALTIGTFAVATAAFSTTRGATASPSLLKNTFGLSRTSPTCSSSPAIMSRSSSSSAMKMSASPADFVKNEVAANDVVVFSKSFCPFCRKTKTLLEDLKIPFTAYELNDMDDGADIQASLLDLTGQKTVPNVFVKGNHLGGNDDVQAAAKGGKLQAMLE